MLHVDNTFLVSHVDYLNLEFQYVRYFLISLFQLPPQPLAWPMQRVLRYWRQEKSRGGSGGSGGSGSSSGNTMCEPFSSFGISSKKSDIKRSDGPGDGRTQQATASGIDLEAALHLHHPSAHHYHTLHHVSQQHNKGGVGGGGVGGIGAMEKGCDNRGNKENSNLVSGGGSGGIGTTSSSTSTTTSTHTTEKLWRKHRQFYYSLYLFIKKSNKHLVRQKKLVSALTLAILCLGFTVLVWYNSDKLVLFLEWLRSIGMWGNVLFVLVFIIVGFPFMLGYIPLTVCYILLFILQQPEILLLFFYFLKQKQPEILLLFLLIQFNTRLGPVICMGW